MGDRQLRSRQSPSCMPSWRWRRQLSKQQGGEARLMRLAKTQLERSTSIFFNQNPCCVASSGFEREAARAEQTEKCAVRHCMCLNTGQNVLLAADVPSWHRLTTQPRVVAPCDVPSAPTNAARARTSVNARSPQEGWTAFTFRSP